MGVWSRLKRTLGASGGHEAEIEEELQFHLAMDAAGGRPARDAKLRLGNATRIAEETRAAGVISWLESAARDARYGLRQMRRTPAVAAAVVVSIAIGVGANAAIFSLVDAALLKPLPVNEPGALRIVEWTADGFPANVENINGDFDSIGGGRVRGSSIGAALYRKLAQEQKSYAAFVGVADPLDAAAAVSGSPAEQVKLQFVSANFFQGLGVEPALGRGFRAEEDVVGQEPVTVVSERFWRQHLDGVANALGRTIRINNTPVRIVGVAPAGFFGVRPGQWVDLYAPLASRTALIPAFRIAYHGSEDDHDWWVRMLARLRPEVSEDAALAATGSLFANLAAGPNGDPAQSPRLVSRAGARGFGGLHREESGALWILMLLVGVLLLLVCANVANLLLARSVYRQRESAVRLALGAGRARLFRQHWIESGLLALIGGAAGTWVGYLVALSIELLFETGRGRGDAFDLHVSGRVLAYTCGISMVTAFLFGLAPAIRSAGADLHDALQQQTRSVIGGRMRMLKTLVSVQIALCLTALGAAGLLARTLGNLNGIGAGFERERLAYASVNPLQAGYTPERLTGYLERLRQELARIPGVIRVSAVEVRLLSGNGNASRVVLPGQPAAIERGVIRPAHLTTRNRVGEGFFETMGIPLIAGRSFEARDFRENSDAAIVDEYFARKYFPNQNPVGRRFGFSTEDPAARVIVGVVGGTRYNSLRDAPPPNLFEPLLAASYRGIVNFAIRTAADPAALGGAVRRAAAAADPAVPLIAYRTQNELIDGLLRTERLLSFVSAAFGIVALALAAIGLGGLLAYSVARRTNEIGVRLAMGAVAGDVLALVLRDALWMLASGVLLGLPCAYAVARLLEKSLFGVRPADPLTAAAACASLLAVALIAAWIPARRAAGIDPMKALRTD